MDRFCLKDTVSRLHRRHGLNTCIRLTQAECHIRIYHNISEEYDKPRLFLERYDVTKGTTSGEGGSDLSDLGSATVSLTIRL